MVTLATSCLSSLLLYAEEEERQWEVRNYHTVRIDRKHDDDHTYLTRLEVPWHHRISPDWDVTLTLEPFGETRYKWEPEQWNRTETGVEAGIQLTRFGYVGESIHYAWLKDGSDTVEFESKLEMFIPFVLNSNGYEVTLWLLEEYTFSAQEGKATRNEIAGYLVFPIAEHLDVMGGWHHIDRIHDYDSDQIEVTAILRF
jgi:hypothetical protein